MEVAPNPDPQLSLPVHQTTPVVNGIHLLENLKLDQLAAKRVYEFAFTIQPLKLRGGTGSTVAPAALRQVSLMPCASCRARGAAPTVRPPVA